MGHWGLLRQKKASEGIHKGAREGKAWFIGNKPNPGKRRAFGAEEEGEWEKRKGENGGRKGRGGRVCRIIVEGGRG